MQVALASEDGFALEHLAKNAASSPHVNGRCVPSELQQELWRPVPPGYDQRCVLSPSLAVALSSLWYRFIVVSRKTEICYLQASAVVDEQVGSLHISVKDVVVV